MVLIVFVSVPQIRWSCFMAAAILSLSACAPKPLSPELSTPVLAVKQGLGETAGKIYFTPEALSALPGSAEENARLAAMYRATLHNPKAWRALYRQERFDTVLLTGDPAAFRPLLEHLRESADWVLTYVDATSMIFRRTAGATPWTLAALDPLRATFAALPQREQLLFRVQTIHRLAALHRLEDAKALLDETLKLDPDFPPALTELASWHAMQAQWEPALAAATRAVKSDKNYLPAVEAEANALFAHGRFQEALARTRRLVREQPENGASLYLHAKVTHAARAFQEEIEVLQKIIAMAEAERMPTGTWRVYLGQAYGATGDGVASIAQFELALKDQSLSEAERKFATRAIERIKGREPIL